MVEQISSQHVALGDALRELRHRRGLTQAELAELTHMDRTYIGGIERGERNPAYTNLLRLTAALDSHPAELTALARELE